MPYCCQCGKEVGPSDAYCAHCGGRQPSAAKPRSAFLSRLSSRNASLLCYIPVVGWIPAIVVLASSRFRQDRDVRFHAFQGLYLFVAWLIVDWAVGPFFAFFPGHFARTFTVAGILKVVIFATWIFMIIKTSQNETYRLPIFGELAERSVAEQR
jgi:uncharacterized membrane protein